MCLLSSFIKQVSSLPVDQTKIILPFKVTITKFLLLSLLQTPAMTAPPRPKLDLFNDSPCLLSKKSRTSTPSLRPPKPPTKSSNHRRRQGGGFSNLDDSFNGQLDFSFTGLGPGAPSIATSNIYGGESTTNVDRMYREFEVIKKIGSGYFADVFKVRSCKDNQYYAIKKTSLPFTSNSDRLRKLQEVKNHQSLPPHPNCVKYIDSWEEDGYLFIQTELCKTNLNEILEISEEHKLPEQIVWNYLKDLLSAVKHLHDHNLLHLDIKPDNIFIAFDGVAKLGDFGLMCSCLDLNSSTISFHDDSGIMHCSDESIDSIDEGDSKYLASETMQGKFTKAADIFSLGITIFEVASGLDLPQRGEIYHKLRHNEIEDLYLNGLSAELAQIIKMMMEEDYTKRPTVDELIAVVSNLWNQRTMSSSMPT